MKIEIGESLALSYLKHVKKCTFYQTNWKSSSQWAKPENDMAEDIFHKIKHIEEYVKKKELENEIENRVIELFKNIFPNKELKKKIALCQKLQQTVKDTTNPTLQQTEIDTIKNTLEKAEIDDPNQILEYDQINAIKQILELAETDNLKKTHKNVNINDIEQIFKKAEIDALNQILKKIKIKIIDNILKQAETDALNQILKQAEIDVLGIGQNGKIYTIDIAYHEDGLRYSSKSEETKEKLIKKFLSSYMMLLRYFPDRDYEITFASPKVIKGTDDLITQTFNDLNTFFDNNVELKNKVELKNNVEFKYISNEEFRKEILDKTIKASESDSDSNELFMRSYKLLKLFNKISTITEETTDLDKEIPPTASLVLEFKPSEENAIQAITDKS